MLLHIQKDDQMKELSPRLENYTKNGNHIFLNYAHWCGACKMFMPQWSLFERMAGNNGLSIIKIESSGLSSLPYTNNHLYNKLSNEGQMYFPMVYLYVNGKRYFYEGARTAEDLQKFYESKAVASSVKKVSKPPAAKKPVPKPVPKPAAKAATAKKPIKKKTPSTKSIQQTIDKFMKMKMV